MNHERLKNIASAIQSVVVSIAICFGGGWAFFEYVSLSRAERARLEIEELRARQPVVNISLATTEESIPTPADKFESAPSSPVQRLYLHVIATIINVGEQNIELNLGETYLIVSRVWEPNEEPVEARTKKLNTRYKRYFLLRAGSSYKLEFMTEINVVGLYRIEFTVPVPSSELQRFPRLVDTPRNTRDVIGTSSTTVKSEPSAWKESTYYVVKSITSSMLAIAPQGGRH